MANSHSHSFWVLGVFLGGPNVAIGNLFYWLMADSHSHSIWALGAVCTMVCFIPCPPAISFTHLFHTYRSEPVLHSHKVLTLHQDWTRLGLCVPWVALSPLPSHSLTHSTPTGLSQCFAHIKSSPCIKTGLGWLCLHLHPTPCLLTLIHPPHPVLFSMAHWL